MLYNKLGDGLATTSLAAGLVTGKQGYEAALVEQADMLRVADAFFQRYALWILPVSMGEAIRRQRGGGPIDVDGTAVPYSLYLGAYTVPTTVFETPALTIPVGFGRGGMPIGVQVHGPRFADRKLLETARQVLAKYVTVRVPPAMESASQLA